ncbi:MAG: ferrous iron transport protein B [Clostridia bacterium]|nr:ferrous iron transport protein B [Deltaproteobacteria bacterium]
MDVAIAGNPNSGKTTLFNAVTGARAKVGNYPGVTVERKSAPTTLPSGASVRLVDLPGCYSLIARSGEEEVAHHVLTGRLEGQRPALVLCTVDATNVARALYLVLQLIELDIPVVVALNMIDIAETTGVGIDASKLSERLGVPVIATAARERRGVDELMGVIDERLKSGAGNARRIPVAMTDTERRAVDSLRTAGAPSDGEALWLLTSNLDDLMLARDLTLSQLAREKRIILDSGHTGAFSRRLIEARYASIDRLLDGVLDTRHVKEDSLTANIDRFLLHPVYGLLAFAVAMFLVFQTIFTWAQPAMDGIEWLIGTASQWLETAMPESMTRSLLIHGVLAGVGSVLVFLPQIAFLFLLLTILEESGYLARAAFLLDRLMRRVGLHGKAFVPLMSGFACAVPAIMAARTIESRRDRLVTIMATPFMSCSARLPIYVLVVAAVFSSAKPVFGCLSAGGLVITAMYFLGFAAGLGTAFILKRTVLKSPAPPFIMELPTYKMPSAKAVVSLVYDRCRVFVVQTGTVILALSLILWALLSFPAPKVHIDDPSRADAIRLEGSFGGQIGRAIEPAIKPLGFDWRIGIGLVASFAAREVLVSTLGQVYALGSEVEADSPVLREALLADKDPATGSPRFTPLVGISLLVFFILAMQCLSTVATIKRETNSWRWPIAQLVYMNTLAYVASLIVYQGGKALGF